MTDATQEECSLMLDIEVDSTWFISLALWSTNSEEINYQHNKLIQYKWFNFNNIKQLN